MADATRTCVVGRDTHPRDALVRLVASPDGEVIVDYRARLPGRGVWILPTAERLAGLARVAPRVTRELGAHVDAEAVVAAVHDAVLQAARDGIAIAAAAGVLVVGQERLAQALAEGRVDLVAVASDASPRTLRALERAGPDAAFVALPLTAATLGAQVGKGTLAAVGLQPARAAGHARRQLRRLIALGYR